MNGGLGGIGAPVVFSLGPVGVTSTVIYAWVDMAILVGVSAAITWTVTLHMTPGQNVLEFIVEWLLDTIEATTGADPRTFLPLVGTLALFIAVGNTMSVVPGLKAPTSDLSTTAALAAIVFFAVPYHGIRQRGFGGYLRHYVRPTWIMLPFNIVTEFSRTVALAVRLFGNVMSTQLIVAVLVLLAGFLVPVPLLALSLLTGLVQAYIFSILAMVYVGAVIRRKAPQPEDLA